MALPLGDFNNPEALQAIEPSITEATPGEVQGASLGATFDALPGVAQLRQQQRFNESGPDTNLKPAVDPRTAGSDVDAMAAERGDAPTRVTLQPDEANAKAKAAGAVVTFDKPIADTTVQSVIDDHLTQQQRADVISRNGNSILSGSAARFVTSSLLSLADPINLAAMMIPVAPEAFVAERLAAAAGVFERTAIRAGAGAVNGAGGMALLEPLNYAMSKADYNDWSAGDAMRNIFMGAALGAGGHMLLGGLFGREHLQGASTIDAMPELAPRVAEPAPAAPEAVASVAPARPAAVMDAGTVGPQIDANLKRRGGGIDYALSPSANDIRSMVKDGGPGSRNVRGFLDEDGNVAAIWPSWDLTHNDMADVSGGSIPALAHLASDPLRSVMIEPSRQGLLISNNNIESGPGAHQSNPMPIKDYIRKYITHEAEAPKLSPAEANTSMETLRGAIGQAADGRPVDVAAIPHVAEITRAADDLQAHSAPFADGIDAFHGTPHEFSSFHTDNIGTGEGAQAFGHGLYFAEERAVADGYRQQLTGDTRPEWAAVQAEINQNITERNAAFATGASREDLHAQFEDLERREAQLRNEHSDGNLYQVRLNAKAEELLDWNKSISAQPEIAAKLEAAGIDTNGGAMSGSELHDTLAAKGTYGYSEPEQAAQRLQQAGVKGIRYLDAGSRDVGGTHNIVMFDHKDVQITHKNGVPVAQAAADLRAQADAAAKGMAERAMNPPTDPVLDQAAKVNKATIDSAPQITGEIDKDVAEFTKIVQEEHLRLQADFASGRIIETQEMKDMMLEADHTASIGKASAGYAACLAGKALI